MKKLSTFARIIILKTMKKNQKSAAKPKEFDVPDTIWKLRDDDNHSKLYTSQLLLLRPSDASGLREEYPVENWINEAMGDCDFERKPEKPHIYMLEVSGGKFSLRSHHVD